MNKNITSDISNEILFDVGTVITNERAGKKIRVLLTGGHGIGKVSNIKTIAKTIPSAKISSNGVPCHSGLKGLDSSYYQPKSYVMKYLHFHT